MRLLLTLVKKFIKKEATQVRINYIIQPGHGRADLSLRHLTRRLDDLSDEVGEQQEEDEALEVDQAEAKHAAIAHGLEV